MDKFNVKMIFKKFIYGPIYLKFLLGMQRHQLDLLAKF